MGSFDMLYLTLPDYRWFWVMQKTLTGLITLQHWATAPNTIPCGPTSLWRNIWRSTAPSRAWRKKTQTALSNGKLSHASNLHHDQVLPGPTSSAVYHIVCHWQFPLLIWCNFGLILSTWWHKINHFKLSCITVAHICQRMVLSHSFFRWLTLVHYRFCFPYKHLHK